MTGGKRFFLPVIEWKKFPPVNKYLKIKYSSDYISYLHNSADSSPLIIGRETQAGNAYSIITVDEFYRWEFDMGLLENEGENIQSYWSGLLNYFLNKSSDQDIRITAVPAGNIFEKYSAQNADVIVSPALNDKKDSLEFLLTNDIAINKKIPITELLPTDHEGINKIKAKISGSTKTAEIEYCVVPRRDEKNSDMNFQWIKDNNFIKQSYYNYSNRDNFITDFKKYIKTYRDVKKKYLARNTYFFIILFLLLCTQWFLTRERNV